MNLNWFENEWRQMTPAERRWGVIWAIGLAALLVVLGVGLVSGIVQAKRATLQCYGKLMDPAQGDCDPSRPMVRLTEPEFTPAAAPTRVKAGLYVDRVVDLSVKETGWTVDFYVWFSWRGGDLPNIGDFDVVDGAIESRDKARETADGDQHYVLYRVLARISKFFDVRRFPRDDHLLTIAIEHPAFIRDRLLFVADGGDSEVSSRVNIPGYTIYRKDLIEKPHSYKTRRGDPALAAGIKSTYSQLRYGIGINRPDIGLYFKLFQGLFVAVAIAMLALFIKPTNVDPRFGLGVGALFAAVANFYMTSQLEPDTGEMALADIVNGLGVGMILLTLIESTVSLHIFEQRGHEDLSRWLDKASFTVMALGYLAINLALPTAASI